MSYLLDPKQTKNILEGLLSEQALRAHVNKLNFDYLSPDLIMSYNNDYIIAECKFQEAYDKFKGDPNRYGHGLPPGQFNKYCDVLNRKNIDTMLFIFCRTFKKLYYQKISILQNLEDEYKLTTKTGSRIVFDISKYQISKWVSKSLFDEINSEYDKCKSRWENILNVENFEF